jgi:hypothetical protein
MVTDSPVFPSFLCGKSVPSLSDFALVIPAKDSYGNINPAVTPASVFKKSLLSTIIIYLLFFII